MLKNKSLALLVLFGHAITYNTLQSRIQRRQPIQQPQQPIIAQPQIQQPIVQQAAQQPIPQQAPQPARARRPVRRQTKQQPRRQVNRRTKPQRAQQQAPQQIQPPIAQQPIVVPQPVVLPIVPPVQQPVQQPIPAPAQQAQQNVPTAPRLSEFDFGAGSVLPTFINQNGTRYLILSREANNGADTGTYDDFGGKRDKIGPKNNQKKEAHPVITASREFFEEAILSLSIGMSLPDTKKFIDVDNIYTEYVIACANVKYVIYITDFTKYADTFFANFYDAFNTTTSHHSKEKDRIAIVEWDALKTVVNNAPFNTGVVMDALVLNPLDQKWYTEKITLRPIFVKKLRPFWMDKPYQQGLSSKIHFY